MIEVKGFTFSHQDSETPVIDGLDLTIEQGEWLLISGSSGCGKSTLALALAGYLGKTIPGESSGEIKINNVNINELEMREISEKVYFVEQNPENQFCTLTVKDELAFGLENRCLPLEEIKSRIQTALAAVNAEDLINRRLEELSGGQQQKIAIATALAMRPEVLILDEPTSNLDVDAMELLLRTLSALRSEWDMSVVIIEHRKNLLKVLASRHLEMRQGRLFEEVDGQNTP